MKKIAKFFLIIVLLISYFPSSILSVYAAEEPSLANLINDDYENETIATLPEGYNQTASADGVTNETSAVYVDSVPGDSVGNASTNALRVFDNDGPESKRARTIVTKTFEPQTGSFVTELDIMEPKAIGNSYPIRLEDKENGKSGIILEVSGGNLGYRGSDGSWKQFIYEGENIPLESYQWYHVKILADINNATSDIYINDMYVGNIPFYEEVESLNAIEAQTAGSSVGDIYWDNAQVYVEATDSPKGLSATIGDQKVELNWISAKGASSYNIKRSTNESGPFEVVESGVSETRYVDSNLVNDETYYYVVSAVNTVGESNNSNQVIATPTVIPNPPASPSGLSVIPRDSQIDLSWGSFGQGRDILFVGTGVKADEKTIKHLELLGFSVTLTLDSEVVSGDESGYSLVFVGESSGSAFIGDKFKTSTVPVVYAEPFALDDVNLSNDQQGMFGSYENQTAIKIADSSHPLAAGLNGMVEVYSQVGKINFGTPSEDATIIATVADDDTKAAIFAYEKGSKNVQNETVPARQVSTFLFAGQEDVMTVEGWKLIDESVKWALGIDKSETRPKETYNIKRSTDPGGPYTTVASDIEETNYRDFGLDNDINYYYVVTAENIGGESEDSEEIRVMPVAPLQAPSGLTATAAEGKVTINWDSNDGALSYDVKRSTENGKSYDVVASSVSGTDYTDTSLTNGKVYYYVVSAKNETTTSANSESVRVVPTLENGIPAIPADIEVTAGNSQVVLTWPSVTDADSYTIKRGAFDSGSSKVIASNVHSSSFQDVDLKNGETYDYVVSAVNEHGESYNSEPVAVTPAKVTVVAKDGSGDFENVQAAIDSIPDNSNKREVIYIKNGEYREKLTVPASKTNLSFVGESKEGAVLVYDDNANTLGSDGNPIGTSKSSSIFIYANDFIAKNLTFQNDSGEGTGQAVAAYVRGDRAYFENVQFLGYQDTLYTNDGRHYYKDCYIEGDVDFIFGAATAVFDSCQINSKRDKGMLTAASTPQDREFGYVFLNSEITADEGIENVGFGRPWRPYSAVSFINTHIDSSIAPDGWDNWGDESNEKTARYSEYNSQGPGANPKERDGWTKQLTPEEANQYTVQNVLEGNDDWDVTRIGIIPLTETSPPIITVDQHDTFVKEDSFTISGKLDNEAVLTVNEIEVPLHSDFSFSTTIQLDLGVNIITVEAIDEDGNLAIPLVLKVTYDNESPIVTLDPLEGEKNGNHYNSKFNPYPVSGKLSEKGTVLVDGEEVDVSTDLTFDTKLNLKSGLNKITVSSVDVAGNLSAPVVFNVVPEGDAVPPGPVKITKAEATNPNTIEVTFNSKLKDFDPSDIDLQTAMGNWSELNPKLTSNFTIENTKTQVKDGKTVAIIEIKEALNNDATITRPNTDNPHNIPYLKVAYYSGDRDKDIVQAEYLLTWQLDNGGWYKNMEDKYNREWDGQEAKSGWYTKEDGELGTIDNNATINELLFLAVMYKETGYTRYKESVHKGLAYLLEAQYESGGWAQAYPARGGYSDYVTYNDNAMIRVMNLLTMVNQKNYPFNSDLVNEDFVKDTRDALESGLDYILKSQIKVNGELTAWCAQHDPETYEALEARIYEHPSISGSESVGIVQYLMSLPNPSEDVKEAIDGALNWFEASKVEETQYVSGDPEGQYFYSDPSSTTWYRFYDIETNNPIFSGRDGVIKNSILEIEKERRDGYRWAGNWPEKLLEVAKTTGYYENRVYVKIVGDNSYNAAGETLETGELVRIEDAISDYN
ncbi:pectate lyase [Salipaludibacillus neizhouensis]|uniref:Pectate lyase n=1 Tax=Salipaludibacillus neizhouensis TaxID=885475 RepID=A0A3A9KAS0_9BACI|nr:pectate lyase [Salipaludibacillus neizhouensis]RKL69239.1 pectate lyase [Salipaludibacillus neizhouensis]